MPTILPPLLHNRQLLWTIPIHPPKPLPAPTRPLRRLEPLRPTRSGRNTILPGLMVVVGEHLHLLVLLPSSHPRHPRHTTPTPATHLHHLRKLSRHVNPALRHHHLHHLLHLLRTWHPASPTTTTTALHAWPAASRSASPTPLHTKHRFHLRIRRPLLRNPLLHILLLQAVLRPGILIKPVVEEIRLVGSREAPGFAAVDEVGVDVEVG